MKQILKSLGCAGVVIFGSSSEAFSGQEEIDEIQVTATRRVVSVDDVSAPITIIPSEDITSAKVLTDSIVGRPGVFMQQTTPGQGAAIIRGLKGSEVLHLVDGIRLNNAIFRNAPTQYMALVAPGTLEKIEIVRGASASLYGSDAVGGVVQALSHFPSFDSAGSHGNVFLGFDTADLAKIVRASAEFGNEKVATLISGEYLKTGNRKTGDGTRAGPSSYESKAGRVAAVLKPDNSQTLLFDLQISTQPMTPRFDELVPGYGQAEPSSSEFFFAPNERIFAHARYTKADWFGGAELNLDIGWQRIIDDRILRDFLSSVRRHETNSSDLLGLTTTANWDTDNGFWVAGVEFYRDNVASERYEEDTITGDTQIIAPRFPNGSSVVHNAVYGHYTARLSESQSLSGGVRFSGVSTQIPATPQMPTITVRQDDLSADLGWVFDLHGNTQLTVNVSYGFRAPNIFDLGTLGDRPGNRFNIPNPALTSERITQVDFGVRYGGERWDGEAVVFGMQYRDRITSVLTGDITSSGRDVIQSRNVASADIYGFELNGEALLRSWLSVRMALNYSRGGQLPFDGMEIPADRIPPLNGFLGVDIQVTDSWSLEPYLLFADSQTHLSPRDIRDPRIDPEGTAGWATINLRSQWYINDRLQLDTRLENLTDRHYRLHGSGIDAIGRNLQINIRAGW